VSWLEQAPCKGHSRLFYPPRGEQPRMAVLRERQAARMCADCPVIEACLADDLEGTSKAQDIDGFRAGLPADARRQLYRRHHGLAHGERRPTRKVA
jgi:hypothetical protein